jgi:hypothetical protein
MTTEELRQAVQLTFGSFVLCRWIQSSETDLVVNKKDKSVKFVEQNRVDTGGLPGSYSGSNVCCRPQPPEHRRKLFTKDLRTFKADTNKDRFGMSDMDVTRLGKSSMDT